ncbi:enoyl-CoA hydratase/isomerase family protein [Streptomyces sp. TP-A0356]|uniref:enoyl-CoA hydratase/isomerase family protein n=1 Tax=Streptomyces sp. TP-A0356 TaxID=1359208 RepID=UPI0006E319A1|nr:enoyl-CoA hydratase/isomerase family protein [Streptomyces sp. TP-A0356]
MTTDDGPVILTEGGAVAILTLNRPDRHNALSTALLSRLAGHLDELAGAGAQDRPRCLLLTGAGRSFCSGADTKEPAWGDLSLRAERRSHFTAVFSALHRIPFPVLAAVEGYALGGGLELALACDLVIAGGSALFGLPELGIGAVPGGGAVHSLMRRAGRGVAARMLLTGERISAREGAGHGVVDRVTEDGSALATALDVAGRLSAHEPDLLTAAARLLRDSGHLDRTAALGLESGFWWEAAARRS